MHRNDGPSTISSLLTIEELTKTEHDLYMMGVTMACLGNPAETSTHKERKKLRAKYRFMVR